MGRHRINASPAVLDRVANRLSRVASRLNTQKRGLDNAAQDTERAWSSQYTPVFVESVQAVERNLGNTSHSVSALAQRLHEIADEIRELERELSRD